VNPLDKWRQFFRPEETYLPVDPDELDEICCDTEERVISHVGVEIMNCFFNCFELDEIRRQLPSLKDPYVKVKFRRDSLSHIWVVDPKSGHRIRVANVDPEAAELSAYEMSEIVKLQSNRKKTHGEIVAFAEALRRMKEIGQSLLRANTQNQRRRGFKMLGLVADEELTPLAPSTRRTRRKAAPATPRTRKPREASPPLPLVERVDEPLAPPKTDAAHVDIESILKAPLAVPIFGVTKRVADKLFVGGSDADTR